jgi:hypothetical protein
MTTAIFSFKDEQFSNFSKSPLTVTLCILQTIDRGSIGCQENNQLALDAVATMHKQLLASIEFFKQSIHAMKKMRLAAIQEGRVSVFSNGSQKAPECCKSR